MGYTDLLIHRCTISRKTEGERDGYGEPASTWADLATAQPCRLTQPKGVTKTPVEGEYVEKLPVLFIGTSVTVTEADRIIGTTGFTDTYDIQKVRPAYDSGELHHYELDLKEVAN
jgi:hypothetical protein